VDELNGWFPDPSGRHQLRHFVNSQPTNWVSDGGRVSDDPMPSATPAPGPTVVPNLPTETESSEPEAPPVTAPAAAAWLADPADPERLRYWDGEQWTGRTAPGPAVVEQPVEPSERGT
jgi:hypothetical protein